MALELIGAAALGSFFQTVFQELTVILHKGLGRRWDLNSELKKLERKLASAQAVIDDAERRRYTEPDVNYWVDDLRELIYDIDDTFDEMNIRRLELEQEAAKSQDEVLDFFSYALDKGKEVQFKASIKSKIKHFLEKLDEAVKDGNDLGLRRNPSVSSWALSQARVTSPSIDESEVYGRQEDKESIIELLFAPRGDQNKKNYSVIPIVGMGGVGKTTLAQIVFRDEQVKSQFPIVRSWACVSDVFDVDKVTRELVEYSTGQNCLGLTSPALQDRLESMVRGERVFLVLDDIWTEKEWDRMKAPLSHCGEGSVILITTRSHIVAKAIGNRSPYELGFLDDERCWDLFSSRAFGEVVADVDENLVQLGKKIVQKCKGVPLAVKVLGAMLLGAEKERWEAVLKNDLWHLQKDDDEIFPALRLSYHYLPSPLKRCFEYLSLFPTDYMFRDKDKLVYLWIGEGLVEAKEGRALEDIGRQYFDDLKRRCLIQKDDKVHDLVHNLACTISVEFYCRLQSDRKSCKSLARTHHASIAGDNVDEGEYKSLVEARGLRTILLFGSSSPRLLLDTFSEWKLLRVVALRGSGLSELPESIGELKHLRFLDLSENSGLKNLPEAICELLNLRWLDLSSTSISSLPVDVGNLLDLRWLDLSCTSISSLPVNVGNLLDLRWLDLSSMSISSLPVNVGNLLDLRWLRLSTASVSSLPEDVGNLLNLKGLDLSRTSISSLPEDVGNLLNLESLNLSQTSLSSLPNSICKLYNLKWLSLNMCRNLAELPEDIGNLNSLEALDLIWTDISRLPDSIVKATNLQNIDFYSCQDVKLPPYLGKLTCLQGLNAYHVTKESGRGIEELKDLNNLTSDKLVISGLENIESVEKAEMADLKSKKHIQFLEFKWSPEDSLVVRDGKVEAKVLEALEPHPTTLKYLSFEYYSGDMFPKWINGLFSLTELNLEGLHRARTLVGIELPSLEDLVILNCPGLWEVSMVAPKLRSLKVKHCQELKLTAVAVLVSLQDETCVNLMTQLEKLYIDYIDGSQLESLQQLVLQAADFGVPLKLTDLGVVGCQNNITSFPLVLLRNFPSLKWLKIKGFSELLPDDETFPSSLKIFSCDNLTHLPKDLHNLTSLRQINISSCPQLRSITFGGLPTSLTELHIKNCDNLTHLGGLPTSLTELHIKNCDNLTHLPKDLHNLTSLRQIDISSCPQLEIQQEDRLAPGLFFIFLGDCPKVEQQIEQESTADWPVLDSILKCRRYWTSGHWP